MHPRFPLYLASSSQSRKNLLSLSAIPFHTIEQHADELAVDHTLPLEQLVSTIALHKMEHAVLPSVQEDKLFVLSADTLSVDMQGVIHGKPHDYNDAKEKIRALRAGSLVSTGFCLDKKLYKDKSWQTEHRVVRAVSAYCVFNVPDEWLDIYIQSSGALHATGGITIEAFGMQFLEKVEGSYSTILGLPLFELREALTELGFFQ